MQAFDNNYDIETVFNSFFQCKGRRFLPPNIKIRGVSDNNNGVQWNSTIDLELNHLRLGVNLEGMKYGDINWPIANFIENELKGSKLLAISPLDGKDIIVGITRDAWQVNVRPIIKEKIIGGKKIPLNSLTNEVWKKILTEAYACLDENKNHRARAKQKVTQVGKGEKLIEMEVSPHLNIYKVMSDNYTPKSFNEAINLFQECYNSLLDIYEVVVSQSKPYKYF